MSKHNNPPTIITLQNSQLTLQLAPACGGAISAFRYQQGGQAFDIMRPASQAALADNDVLATASFPLIPFSNRIAQGEFNYQGQQAKLDVNMPPHPHPLHGQAWRQAWTIDEHNEHSATLGYQHPQGGNGWPWQYSATQHFELRDNELIISLTTHNEDSSAMPVGTGLHPYFPRTDDVEIDIPVKQVWLTDELCIPTELIDIPQDWRLNGPRTLSGLELDHCFTGWDGQARIRWPQHKLQLTLSHQGPLRYMVVFVPKGEDFFCVEPVSNITDFINMANRNTADTGLIELAPKESLSVTIRFNVETLSQYG